MANIKLKAKIGTSVDKQKVMYFYTQGMSIPLIACKMKTTVLVIKDIIKGSINECNK